jgi:endonuclease YncB( thermonuclease family)
LEPSSKMQNLKTNQRLIIGFLSLIFVPPLFFGYLTYSTYKRVKNPFLNAALSIVLGFITTCMVLSYPNLLKIYFSGFSESPEPVNTEIQVNSETAQESTEPTQQSYEIINIIDGDTLRISYNGESTPVRLIATEAPELSHPSEPVQCYAQEAKDYLQHLLAEKQVLLESEPLDTDRDQYDRLLRYIFLEDGTNVNESLIKNGYALENTYVSGYKYQQLFREAQQYAEQNKLGRWSETTCDGNVYTGTYKDPKPEETPPDLVINPTHSSYSATDSENTASSSPSYVCSCGKTCGQMTSCEEAYYQLNHCGCSARDGDEDGIPCESLCL